MNIREEIENIENSYLHPRATKNSESKGRPVFEEKDDIRPPFQRDRDRIIHSKSFRRLKHKTQVFISPTGDHYRTRLTHTLEVSQIGRTIAMALHLNESLTEAIALGHDLGHTPFGHFGEEVLNELSDEGFRHYEHSLRVVDKLENEGKGLNLTYEVRDGILKHSKGFGDIFAPEKMAETLEGQIIRFSDIVAYVNHDLDDAIRAGLIKHDDIPKRLNKILGKTRRERINTMVRDIIFTTKKYDYDYIRMSEPIYEATVELREFLKKYVYKEEEHEAEKSKIMKILKDLFYYIMEAPDEYIEKFPEGDSVKRRVIDFIAGMTDRFAINLYEKLFVPKPWSKL